MCVSHKFLRVLVLLVHFGLLCKKLGHQGLSPRLLLPLPFCDFVQHGFSITFN